MKHLYHFNAPKRCDCIVWAMHRFFKRGGYVCFRRSLFSRWVIHVFWSRDQKVWWGYTTEDGPATGPWWQAVWFKGHIVMGDARAIERHVKRSS